MPANEQTWRNQTQMHLIFGISSAAMLVATVWMIADDHNREWKTYQETYYEDLETWTLQSRIYQQMATDYEGGRRARADVLQQQKELAPPAEFGELFLLYVARHAVMQQASAAAGRPGSENALPDASPGTDRFYAANQTAAIALELNAEAADLAVNLEIDRRSVDLEADPRRRAILEGQIAAAEKRLATVQQRLQQQVQAAAPLVRELLEEYRQQLPANRGRLLGDVQQSLEVAVQQPSAEHRAQLTRELDAIVKNALFSEEVLQRDLKFLRAELDEARSAFNLAFGNDAPQAELGALQAKADQFTARTSDLNARYEAAKTYRERLEKSRDAVNARVNVAQKSLDRYETEMERLRAQLARSKPGVGKDLINMPILDAFSKEGDIKVRQIWLPELTINFNFKDVARFDRCMTCHLGIEKTAPGSAVAAGYPAEQILPGLMLESPAEPPLLSPAEGEDPNSSSALLIPNELDLETQNQLLLQAYGFSLAPQGVFRADDATIEFVMDRSRAANARLQRGDVILSIGSREVLNRGEAADLLLGVVQWGQPLELKIRRGVPQPYSTHPRLDLFGASTSPHSFAAIGCTVCHDGQGSATAFKWASHTPNTVEEEHRWTREYGWFNNHHWIFPMMPKRFSESLCLKCHHDVVELSPSERFAEPPAPKLMEGFNLVQEYGCFGCHEIKGFDGPNRRIGPDLRLEPGYAFAGLALFANPKLYTDATYRKDHPESYQQRLQQIFGPNVVVKDGKPGFKNESPRGDEELAAFAEQLQKLAGDIVDNPSNDTSRRRLVQLLQEDEARARNPISLEPPFLSAEQHRLALVLADTDTPGAMRPVGPSLRYLSHKLSKEFVFSWIQNPRDFRPQTKMPRFFGLDEHLLQKEVSEGEAFGNTVDEPAHTHKMEAIEIRALTEYLLTSSQPFIQAVQPEGVTEQASAERGKDLFANRGCLACHQHTAFPDPLLKADQGPDLSNIGTKLQTGGQEAGEKGARWLYTWLKNPSHYSVRTKMPNMLLDPITDREGKVSDPAADIALFLMGSTNNWQPAPLPRIDQEALDRLALDHLQGVFTRQQAQQYLQTGIPLELASEIKGDEGELLGRFQNETERVNKILRFVGSRTVRKYGCFACHDVPGMETAKPIGTALADWGRKEPSKIAFNQIGQFVKHTDPDVVVAGPGGEPHLQLEGMKNKDKAFFLHALLGHHREGFLWQKLRAPRSFDYEMTQNQRYDERLRMPQFPFDDKQREAVMTFVLGLVAEPPADQFVYQADPRQKALNSGRAVIEKFNCGGCHTLDMPKYTFTYDPSSPLYSKQQPPAPDDFHALFKPHYTPRQVSASRDIDSRGLGTATISAMRSEGPRPGELGTDEDDEGNEVYLFTLWQDALIDGNYWLSGDRGFRVVPSSLIPNPSEPSRPAWGGDFARWLYPRVVEQRNPKDLPSAWGYVPPPLMGEGTKVQPAWLYDFLLEPYPIRPAVVLRMPKFNFSPHETSALVDFFAARDNAKYPYDFVDRKNDQQLAAKAEEYPQRLDDALKIITNRNYCVACHLVGDFAPDGGAEALAPNLDQVHSRLRPDYLERWIANPKHILPYTAMFSVIKPEQPIRPDKFQGEVGELIKQGTPMQQIDAIVDLLLNYDRYMKNQVSIKPLIQGSAPAETEADQ